MSYDALLQSIVALHREAQRRAALAVNRWLIQRNWLIGAYVVEFEQTGEDRAAYGERLLERISADLKRRHVRGLGLSMLRNCRLAYCIYPQLRRAIPENFHAAAVLPQIRQSPIGESAEQSAHREGDPTPLPPEQLLRLSWTHWIELLHIEDPWKRAFYENECLKGSGSVRRLQRQIGSLLYQRTGLSTDKRGVIEAVRVQAAGDQSGIADLIRDPYVLEFIGLTERPRYRESDLERALLDHLHTFLLELGTGFCFEARQRRITVANEHDYVDLVFYHRFTKRKLPRRCRGNPRDSCPAFCPPSGYCSSPGLIL